MALDEFDAKKSVLHGVVDALRIHVAWQVHSARLCMFGAGGSVRGGMSICCQNDRVAGDCDLDVGAMQSGIEWRLNEICVRLVDNINGWMCRFCGERGGGGIWRRWFGQRCRICRRKHIVTGGLIGFGFIHKAFEISLQL